MFRKLLSKEAITRIEAQQAEVNRLFNLQNRWLAQELLKLAREIQPKLSSEGWCPADNVYDAVFAWQVIPELAKRLGATTFNLQERTDYRVIRSSSVDLRARAGHCLLNCGTQALRESLLTREVANGNPVVFAIDRLSAPGDEDPIARRLHEIANNRGVECHDGKWTPLFMDFTRNSSISPRPTKAKMDEVSSTPDNELHI